MSAPEIPAASLAASAPAGGLPPARAEPAAVAWGMHDWQARPAVRVGAVLMRDEPAGRPGGTRRVFWLLDEGMQLVYEPFGWTGEWYADVVRIEARRDGGQLVGTRPRRAAGSRAEAAPGPAWRRQAGQNP
jgi:hypothetical protein